MTYYVQVSVGQDGRSEDSLFYGDEELLKGNRLQLHQFATVLNASCPREDRIAATLRALFCTCPECSFAPGERLLNDGTAMRRLGK